MVKRAILVGSFFLFAVSAYAQLPRDPEERKKVLAQIFQANARQLTLFDREGKAVTQIGSRDLFNQVVLSPDRTRVALIKPDLEKETNDLWVLDVATGQGTQITTSQTREGVQAPAWSPDGSQLAYVALRSGSFNIYRKASNGTGAEELLYKGSAPMTITDWSMDGRFLGYFSTDLSGGALFALPLNTSGERKPIEIARSKSQLQNVRFSPDSRFVVYVSNETGRTEIYVRPFNATGDATAAKGGPWQISDQGGIGMTYWRRDGRELYFLAADRAIMAVPITLSPDFEFGKPKLLFRPPDSMPLGAGGAMISRDGERVLVAVPPPQLRQLTLFDRQGKVVSTVGQPGLFVQPGLSPDGKSVVVMKTDL